MKRMMTLAVLTLLAAAGCKAPKDEAKVEKKLEVVTPPVKVETGEVMVQKTPRFLTLTGSVLADKQSEVAANVSGRVITTLVERGQSVRAGSVLAVVDSKAAAFQAAAAAAQSHVSETQFGLAKQECERADTLMAQNTISKAEFDRLKTQCQAQMFAASAARNNADLAAKMAGDAVIRAPIDGVVGERYVNVGEYVQPMTRVVSLYSARPARVSISVPESAVGLVKEGQTLQVQVAAYPGRSFPAVVRFVSPVLRPLTRDLIVDAVAKNDDGALKPGMFAMVKLLTGEDELPTVPQESVKMDGTTRRIWLARQGVAHEVVVRTGETLDGRVAVYEPLQPRELVVVKPPAGLRDGAAILQ